jgi:hypothetical protein
MNFTGPVVAELSVWRPGARLTGTSAPPAIAYVFSSTVTSIWRVVGLSMRNSTPEEQKRQATHGERIARTR